VEVVRAVRRVAPDLTSRAEQVVAQISVVDIGEPIRRRAALLEPATVRSIDALHLATAIEVGDALDVLITYDARMAEAARSLGLAATAPS
jgi:predicted nucleic acid-binding protein